MNFCSACGHAVVIRIPEGGVGTHFACESCGMVHRTAPKNVVGTVSVWRDKVLLCRRAIRPCLGMWTLPAGFMETGETTVEGAQRETREESGAWVDVGQLFSIINVRQIGHVYLFYRATMRTPEVTPGTESFEVRLFDQSQIPWDLLAFPAVERTLRAFLGDRASVNSLDGGFRLHTFDIDGTLDLR